MWQTLPISTADYHQSETGTPVLQNRLQRSAGIYSDTSNNATVDIVKTWV